MGMGDVIAQTAFDKKSLNEIEWSRVGRFALVGSTFVVREEKIIN